MAWHVEFTQVQTSEAIIIRSLGFLDIQIFLNIVTGSAGVIYPLPKAEKLLLDSHSNRA